MALAQKLLQKAMAPVVSWYRYSLGNQLMQYGLQYEDLLIEEDPAVEEALTLADKDVLTGRTRRLKRAIDLSYKRKSLLDYAPDMVQTPFKRELAEDIAKISNRNQEYAQLNAHNKT